jgi:hypothetical protein
MEETITERRARRWILAIIFVRIESARTMESGEKKTLRPVLDMVNIKPCCFDAKHANISSRKIMAQPLCIQITARRISSASFWLSPNVTAFRGQQGCYPLIRMR